MGRDQVHYAYKPEFQTVIMSWWTLLGSQRSEEIRASHLVAKLQVDLFSDAISSQSTLSAGP